MLFRFVERSFLSKKQKETKYCFESKRCKVENVCVIKDICAE